MNAAEGRRVMVGNEAPQEPIEVALEHVANELHLNTKMISDIFPSRPKALTLRRLVIIGVTMLVVLLALIGMVIGIVFGILIPNQDDSHKTLTAIQAATGPKAQAQAQAATALYLNCLVNRLEHDLIHARLDPRCASVFNPPSAPTFPSKSTTAKTAPTTAAARTINETTTINRTVIQVVLPHQFRFTFSPRDHQQTTVTCTLVGTTTYSCS